ncbi:hypothetical protein PTKIN_Ptkin09bG0191400 [Pterospermum kingtungense]
MARVLLLLALCVLPALVIARPMVKNPLVVQGYVYCDRCLAGFETEKAESMAGAEVEVRCADRKTGQVVYKKGGCTDSTGHYKIVITEDHLDEVCDAVLVKSSVPDCAKMSPGREQARVILTNYNGLASSTRFANAMGFMADKPEAGCTQIMQQYQEQDV